MFIYLNQFFLEAMINSTNNIAETSNDENDEDNMHVSASMFDDQSPMRLQINTSMSDDDVIAMEERSPSVSSPKNMLLKKQLGTSSFLMLPTRTLQHGLTIHILFKRHLVIL